MSTPSLLLVLALALCGCTRELRPEEPRRPASTPDELAASVAAAARAEEWAHLHALLSARTRREHSATSLALYVKTQDWPETDYSIARILARAAFDGALTDPRNPDRAIAYFTYEEPGGPRVTGEVLLVREGGAWRVALEEQRAR